MPKSKKPRSKKTSSETDGVYFLKIVLYFLVSTFWLRLANVNLGSFVDISLPLGLVIGVLFARREEIQTDRKIIYAILLAGTILSFYLPVGIRL